MFHKVSILTNPVLTLFNNTNIYINNTLVEKRAFPHLLEALNVFGAFPSNFLKEA